MVRRLAEVDELVTLGGGRNAPHTMSGWHHHGDHTIYFYVLRGKLRIDWGSSDGESADLSGGDFYIISPNTIHREGNPGSEDNEYLGFYVGSGPIVVNVEGPETEN